MALEQRYPKATAKMRRLLARMRGVGGWSSKDKRFSVMRKFNSVGGLSLHDAWRSRCG